jgi:preprotein translocase subunit SecG
MTRTAVATNSLVLLLFILFFTVTLAFTFYMGHQSHKKKSQQDSIENVRYYLEHTIPNEWTAYKKGVDEGYEQGLRDGQDNLE